MKQMKLPKFDTKSENAPLSNSSPEEVDQKQPRKDADDGAEPTADSSLTRRYEED